MKSALHRFLAGAASLLLLPACWAVALAFLGLAGDLLLSPEPDGWTFITGALAYLLWHRIAPPEFLYTFVHEFTHLVFALITGKKVSHFEVRRTSGKVGLSGTNAVIALAPYFFPLLTVAVLLLGALAEWALGYWQIRRATVFLAGLTLCLHVMMTRRALRVSQPDIRQGGRLFSSVVIFLAGMIFIGGAALVSAGGWGKALSYAGEIWGEGRDAYAWWLAWLADAIWD